MQRPDQDEMGCMDGVYGMGLHGMDGDKLNRNTRIRGVTVSSSTKNNTKRNGLTRTKWDVRMAVYGMGRNGMDGQQAQSYNWIQGDTASSPTKAIPTKNGLIEQKILHDGSLGGLHLRKKIHLAWGRQHVLF